MADNDPAAVNGETITITLSDEVYAALKEIADLRGVGLDEALKEALASERFILQEHKNGSKILVRRSDASVHKFSPVLSGR